MSRIIKHIRSTYPFLNIILESQVIQSNDGELASTYPELISADPSEKSLLAQKTDFVVTLGGDGSILHVSSLFDRDAVPPVLSFSMGTLGFLLPYDISGFREAVKDMVEGNISLLLRMRLRQTSHRKDGETFCQIEDRREGGGCYDVHLMNEVTLHRGREPHMTKIDAYVDGQHLTQAIVSFELTEQSHLARRTVQELTISFLRIRSMLVVGRTDYCDTDRVHRILTFGRRSHRPSVRTEFGTHTDLSTFTQLPNRAAAQ